MVMINSLHVAKSTLFILLLFSVNMFGQIPLSDRDYVNQLKLTGGFPPKLLGTRSFVFHSYTLTEQEKTVTQEYFQRTGIDAVGYFPIDMLTAGRDFTRSIADFLTKREISNLVFVEKSEEQYRLTITTFNGKETIFDVSQPAWSISNRLLLDALKAMNRSALAELKRENLLVNEYPESDLMVDPIIGKRNEFFAVDMKVDLVAIPKFGNEKMDQELAGIMEANFPFTYKLVEPNITEKDLRKQGFLYIMLFVHTRGEVARDLLGYQETKQESAIVSVTYPDSKLQLKTIPSNTVVFKVYFKHIDSGNVFLGTKWDADVTWQQALLNNLRGMKIELRLN
jgi:hypothetical protein